MPEEMDNTRMYAGGSYPLETIVRILGAGVSGENIHSFRISHLLTDSRQLVAPATSLFFALKSPRNDGHRYIPELLYRGVRCFVVEPGEAFFPKDYPDAVFLITENPLKALQQLAAFHRDNFNIPLTAITGSNGKTIVKEWLSQILDSHWVVARSPKSFNSQIGVALSVWQIGAVHTLGVFEAGISTVDEMQQLETILKPDTGIFTNIGPAHDSGFSSRQQKIREKLRLFSNASNLIYCADHSELREEILAWHPKQLSLFSWGIHPDADIRILESAVVNNKRKLLLHYKGNEFWFRFPFNDAPSVENAMHCIAWMLLRGMPIEDIQRGLEKLQAIAMRLELKEGINQCVIINDSYNADLASLGIALDFLNSQRQDKPGSLIVSDIYQTGLPEEVLYGLVADMAKAKKAGRLIGIGPQITAHRHLFDTADLFFSDTDEFLRSFDFGSFRNEYILLKGSRVFGFERIGEYMQQKDHQTILEIDLDALVHNLNVFRSLLKPGVKIMGMVKAFSYGSGSLEVAGALQYHGVHALAVAYADEGRSLREGGIRLPIVVMNPEVRNFDVLFDWKLEPEIYSFDLLDRFIAGLTKRNGNSREKSLSAEAEEAFPVHIKLDTGMHRLGFLPDEVPILAQRLRHLPQIRVASVFSHFAASEDARQDQFTLEQLNKFDVACNTLSEALGYMFLRHISNSAAARRFPEAHLDMVRLGIGLYGIGPDDYLSDLLRPVGTFRSIVSQVKTVAAGGSIGYGRNVLTHQPMQIAIVPVGYADGLNRKLGNGRGKLLINGSLCPIVGSISMDMCCADVSNISCSPGDQVIVFGPGRPVTDIARELETIPYEVLTSVSHRVKRVYYQG